MFYFLRVRGGMEFNCRRCDNLWPHRLASPAYAAPVSLHGKRVIVGSTMSEWNLFSPIPALPFVPGSTLGAAAAQAATLLNNCRNIFLEQKCAKKMRKKKRKSRKNKIAKAGATIDWSIVYGLATALETYSNTHCHSHS